MDKRKRKVDLKSRGKVKKNHGWLAMRITQHQRLIDICGKKQHISNARYLVNTFPFEKLVEFNKTLLSK